MFFFLYPKRGTFFSELNLKNCRETPTSIQRPTGQYKFAIFGNPAKKNLKQFSTTCIVFAIQKTNAFVLYFRKKYIWVSSWYFHIHFFFSWNCLYLSHEQSQTVSKHGWACKALISCIYENTECICVFWVEGRLIFWGKNFG